jgi:hypothetical protein
MKNLLLLALLASCTCTEVIQTKSTNNLPFTRSEGYTYENDTIIVKYSFWANYGIMGMSIYNKLNKPLYIDWGNSALIENGNTFNFWKDQTQAISTTVGYNKYGYDIYGRKASAGVSNTNTTVYRPTRIMSIPPKSQVNEGGLHICSAVFNIYPKPGNYDYDLTPIKFRSYLVLSTEQDIKTQFYVDQEFYVSDAKYIDQYRLNGRHVIVNGHWEYNDPFRRSDWFYIDNIQGSTGMDPYKAYGDPSK